MSESGTRLPSDRLRSSELEDGITSRFDTVTQALCAPPVRISLGPEIGSGGHGVIRACTVHLPADQSMHHLVLKIPRPHVMDRRRARDELRAEFDNAEHLLEPALVRDLQEFTGAPLPTIPASTYFRVVAARCAHASHVGYHFLHRPIQFFEKFAMFEHSAPVPAILSEHADGSLHDLVYLTANHPARQRLHVGNDGAPSPLWTVVAWQVLRGVQFIQSVCGLAHVDLKAANVFYQGNPDAPDSVRCLIGDFGMVAQAQAVLIADTPQDGHVRFDYGTPQFSPLVRNGQSTRITCELLSDFQCLSTLASILVFGPPYAATAFFVEVDVHVTAAISKEYYQNEMIRLIHAPPIHTLVDFCLRAHTMTSWEPLADLCWRKLLPAVEALLRVQAPEVCVRFEERAQAYARDAEEATRCAEVYERQLTSANDVEMTTDDDVA